MDEDTRQKPADGLLPNRHTRRKYKSIYAKLERAYKKKLAKKEAKRG